MKIKNYFAIVAVTLLSAFASFAQGFGFDIFGGARFIQLDSRNLNAGFSLVTNTAVDTHALQGVVCLGIGVVTNTGTTGGTLSIAVQNSPDLTNWVTLANVAYGVNTSITYTNSGYGGTNLTATDLFILPGTITTPNAVTAGWATPYLLPAPYTNSPSALSIAANGYYTLGYNVDDASRYLRLVYSPGGSVTNFSVNAFVISLSR